MARRIGQLFDKVAGKAFARHGGPLMLELARVWEALFPELATIARPEGVRRTGPGPATLTLRVAPACALEVQMMLPQLIERINTHFGTPVIGRVKLVQAPLGTPANAQRPSTDAQAPPDEALLAALRRGLENVRNEELRAVLARMAEGIARKATAASRRESKTMGE